MESALAVSRDDQRASGLGSGLLQGLPDRGCREAAVFRERLGDTGDVEGVAALRSVRAPRLCAGKNQHVDGVRSCPRGQHLEMTTALGLDHGHAVQEALDAPVEHDVRCVPSPQVQRADGQGTAVDGSLRHGHRCGAGQASGSVRGRPRRVIGEVVGAQAGAEPLRRGVQTPGILPRRDPCGLELGTRNLVEPAGPCAWHLQQQDPPRKLAEVDVEKAQSDGDRSDVRAEDFEDTSGFLKLLPLEPDTSDATPECHHSPALRHGPQIVRHGGPTARTVASASCTSRP
ncbi:hypothetical protein FJV46_06480 [Arthrobacter agilis]|nr:hypothetical protein FJV46_06480 [Arthrobacter agilis]